jgi:2-aminobenzoate-CoA ligase
MAGVLRNDFGIESGNRVLLRGANSPTLIALWLAVQMNGAIAVTTLSLLRAKELQAILEMSQPGVAICEGSMATELESACESVTIDCPILKFDQQGNGELQRRMERMPDRFPIYPTLSNDIALIGFTSGTTGRPKATIHFHRDVIAVCEIVAAKVIAARPEDVYIGTAPLAFTFGLGGLLLFPLFCGSSAVLNPSYSPDELLTAIEKHRASICFTVPSFYQRMVLSDMPINVRSLRLAISSGESLPLKVREAWHEKTDIQLTEFLGSTELLHAFAGSTGDDIRPGYIGPAFPGYQLAILDQAGARLPAGKIGRFAVKGPTGCRYLDDPRQSDYVQAGWNITGDACALSEDGYVQYHSRLDDMIISSGYNISGIEVENSLLEHPDVAECAVIGTPDEGRGEAVTAFVVPRSQPPKVSEFVNALQKHVRAQLAPYKYPRIVHLVEVLPRNESGKIQRFRLRV